MKTPRCRELSHYSQKQNYDLMHRDESNGSTSKHKTYNSLKHFMQNVFYNIYATSTQRFRGWSSIAWKTYKCFVFIG